MTTPTTNYGWLKPDPGEPASIVHLNSVMDEMDADIKTIDTAKNSKIYSIGRWNMIRRFNVAANNAWDPIRNAAGESALWEEQFKEIGNVGNFTFDPLGTFRFTAVGVYKLGINLTCFGMTTSTTNGNYAFALFPDLATKTAANIVPTTYMDIRAVTDDSIRLTTLNGNFFLSTNYNVSVDTDYVLAIAADTSFGDVSVSFTPSEYYPLSQSFTLECVRSL